MGKVTPVEVQLGEVISRSGDWLLNIQDKASGGWKDILGKTPSTLNTAEAIIALLDGAHVVPGDVRVQKGVKFLLDHQSTEGSDKGSWPKEVWTDHGAYRIADMVRTSFAIQALIKAGQGVNTGPVESAVNWLLSIKNEDSGWGYCKGSPSYLMPTCFAMMALLAACRAGMNQCEDPITSGLQLLVQRYSTPEGCFDVPGPLRAVHTIYTVLVLQEARRAALSVFTQKETEAIRWLLRNPDDATKMVEEIITIDPATERGNYGFTFMTDSLLIRVLIGSKEKEHRESGLARDAMLSLKDKMDVDGGFYGYRVFSWSTAKVISALCVAKSEYKDFPRRRPEYPGRKSGNFIFAFAVLLSGFVVYLTMKGGFSWLQALFLAFLMLASLLAYGKIGEKSFTELATLLLGLIKKK